MDLLYNRDSQYSNDDETKKDKKCLSANYAHFPNV